MQKKSTYTVKEHQSKPQAAKCGHIPLGKIPDIPADHVVAYLAEEFVLPAS